MAVTGEMPQGITVKDLLDAGVHFGHQTKRWNPKMKRFIFDKRNGIHIIDLTQSLAMLKDALAFLYEVAASGKSILFVGTKKQAQQAVEETAKACGQFFVTNRWLGGTLTNNTTIRASIKYMRSLQALEKDGTLATMPKKEVASVRRELSKLTRNLDGIADMVEMPGAIFVVDINREAIAVAEGNKLHIPIIAMVDTNCDPDPVNYIIPGNDDAIRAIRLIVATVTETVKKGLADYSKVAAEHAKKKEEEAKRRIAAGEPPLQEAPPPKSKPSSRPPRPRRPGDRKDSRAGRATGKTASHKAAKQAAASPEPAKTEPAEKTADPVTEPKPETT